MRSQISPIVYETEEGKDADDICSEAADEEQNYEYEVCESALKFKLGDRLKIYK